MTVAELMDKLKELPPSAEVRLPDTDVAFGTLSCDTAYEVDDLVYLDGDRT